MTAGTGGTVTGIGRKFKELNPNIKIIGVDPKGSILAQPDELNKDGAQSYKVEGIGYDFIPKNCDQTVVDKWYKSVDKDSFNYARRLIKEEGLLVGGSSGAALWGAIEVAKGLPADKRVVVLFVDSVRNYMTKHLNDDWVLENNFLSQEEYDKKHFAKANSYYGEEEKVSSLNIKNSTPLTTATTVEEALAEFEKQKTECVI